MSSPTPAPVTPPYVNTTLSTRYPSNSGNDPEIFVNVYLPPGTSSSSDAASSSTLPYYYQSTRFEGGSMVGPVLITSGNTDKKNSKYVEPWHIHQNCWRFPYNRDCVDNINHNNNHYRNLMSNLMSNGQELDARDIGDGKDALSNNIDLLGKGHNHHGGHHPLNLHQKGFPPNYNFLPPDARERITERTSESHVLYGTDMWRAAYPPGHDPKWPESGVGWASEFGYGDDGAYCIPESGNCGWTSGKKKDEADRPPPTKIINGVLGYDEAKVGEPFLKIGVGKLIKGSCADCDSSDESAAGYKFNSPYEFYEQPVWTVVKDRPYHLVLKQEATLASKKHGAKFGYKLKKSMRVEGRVLSVTSTLTNLGRHKFATPWYSHHFFTCDGIGVGPAGAYGVDLELHPRVDPITGKVQYDDSPWATPISEYAEIRSIEHEEHNDSWFDFFSPTWWKKKETRKTTQITMTKEVEEGTRIKAEFPNDLDRSKGTFVLHGCGTSIAESVPEFNEKIRPAGEAQGSDMSMYAFNLYIEKGTLSPEPLFLIELNSGASVTWTQRIEFGIDDATSLEKLPSGMVAAATTSSASILGGDTDMMMSVGWASGFWGESNALAPALFFAFVASAIYWTTKGRRSKRGAYQSIPA